MIKLHLVSLALFSVILIQGKGRFFFLFSLILSDSLIFSHHTYFVEIDDMMLKWKISSIVKDQTMQSKIKDEMEKEMVRSKGLKEAKKSSKFRRYTAISESIGQNYRMMECLQKATETSEFCI